MRYGGKRFCACMMSVLIVAATVVGNTGYHVKAADSTASTSSRSVMETLTDRALVAVAITADDQTEAGVTSGVYLSWRLLKADDASTITFDIYRNGTKVKSAISETNWTDTDGNAGDRYYVIASSGVGSDASNPDVVTAWSEQDEELQLVKPADETMPDGTTCTYTANDMSVGDLDGDGSYELVVKWYPSNARDNSASGYTGKTFLDAYDFDRNGNATLLWRVDLGINIRSGAHYTQFQVADINNDGKAEVACKTADGTTAYSYNSTSKTFTELGYVGACDSDSLPTAAISSSNDYRNSSGYILSGSEYLTVFNGNTGAIMDTTDYWPARGTISDWGTSTSTDSYGNRCDRFLACTAYLDGVNPSFVFCRGYYGKSTMAAYNMVDGKLNLEWTFSTEDTTEIGSYTTTELKGQGNHNLCVADVDSDGKDEIIYGSMCIDNDGTLKYSTGLGHGDAVHIGDFIPSHTGLEVFDIHESTAAKYSAEIHDANTGEILWGLAQIGTDCGRGLSADIDPTYEGAEMWTNSDWNISNGGVYSSASTLTDSVKISGNTPSTNFSIYWDGDLLSENFYHDFRNETVNGISYYYPIDSYITKWDYATDTDNKILQTSDALTSNGTKGNPGLCADIMGDWREELILRSASDDSKIRIYTTDIPTNYSIPTLMQDNVYRLSIAWQNTAYNQPACMSYALTGGLATAKITKTGTTSSSASMKWTAASDGTYGHSITGYDIYRAGTDGVYSLVAAMDSSGAIDGSTANSGMDSSGNYIFTDTGLSANTTYTYKVSAIVDGEASYKSAPLSVTTSYNVASVPTITLSDIVQDTPITSGETVASLLPEQVSVINSDGETVEADVTWDVSSVDISTPGTYTVVATVDGWSEPIDVSLTVVANTITGYSFDGYSDKTIEVLNGGTFTPPSTVTLNFLNGTTTAPTVTWDTSSVDTSTNGAYTIVGTVSANSNYQVTMTVKVVDDYIVSVATPSAVEVDLNTAVSSISLPSTLTATYETGTTGSVAVTWDTSSVSTATVGSVTVSGTVADYSGTVTLTLNIMYPAVKKFDFGIVDTDVASGYTGVTVNPKGGASLTLGAYTSALGYGFADIDSTTLTTAVVGRNDNTSLSAPDNDYAIGNGVQFLIDLPNGVYNVYYTAAYYGSKNSVKLSAEGGTVYTTSNSANAAATGEIENVELTDGQLTLAFKSGNYSRISQIVIRQVSLASD